MDFYERISKLFQEAKLQTGYSKHRILLDVGVDPAQFHSYKRAGRLLSDDMLIRLGQSPLIPATTKKLLAWKALASYSPEVIIEAQKVLSENSLEIAYQYFGATTHV